MSDATFPEIRTAVIKISSNWPYQEFQEAWQLLPMTKTEFRLDEDIKFEFVLSTDGNASAVKITYRDVRPEVVTKRTG